MSPRLRGPAALLGVSLLLSPLAGCSPDGADGGRLYVTSGLTDEVLVLDAGDGERLRTVPVDPRPFDIDEPHGVAVDPAGAFWYVTVAHGEPSLWKFDTRDDRRVGLLKLGLSGAGRIGITPDGERAFVPDFWRSGQERSGSVAVVRLEDLGVPATPSLCPAPHHAAVDPRGRLVAVTCSGSDEVVLLDAGTLEVDVRSAVGPDPGPPGDPRYRPLNAAWSPSGRTLWVTLRESGEVVSLDREGRLRQRLEVGASPMQLAATPDGRHLVLALRGEGTAAVLDTDPLELRRRVALPDAAHPHGVALDRAGGRAFVTFEGSVGGGGGVVAFRLPDGPILWRREAGRYTLGVAYAP